MAKSTSTSHLYVGGISLILRMSQSILGSFDMPSLYSFPVGQIRP